ncbi:alcohol dehydrogenase class-3 [Eurytemora carolleeae]|uniref:alcohol dehydrogenase class-3 n=1 Tax=Eurytemora carolleeae TaxID=1294199 RepID=UPI000C761A57|nr:alcohol dehydrogenase class-3 [Eurytemora carolleeae]|eukprot:XP_023326636.1 alcohol dehydrogenase class-3-like [Eurytemora affinis]
MPRCGDCYSCKHPRGVGCVNFPTAHHLVNASQTVSARGQKLFPLFGLGTFCEYIVVPTTQLAKLSPETCVDQLAPLGCAVLTGWGAAESVAKVTKEDKVAIWGLGAVGLSALMACVKAKAKIVIAVDVDEDKLKTAVKFGATHTLLANKETSNLIRQICESGVDFAFECSGSPKAEDQAIDSLQFGWGLAVLVGCPNTNSSLSIPTNQFIGQGKSIRGIILGGWKNPKEALTRLAEGYSNDRCPDVSGLVTKEVKLEDVNTALESIVKPHNKDLRVLIRFD